MADKYLGIKLTEEFKRKLFLIAKGLGINPDDLISLMISESKIATGKSPYSDAVGLIQFAVETGGYSLDQIADMNPITQLDLVEQFFIDRFRENPTANPNNIVDLYTLMFLPVAGGYGKGDDFIITDSTEEYYYWNTSLDENNDQKITRGDLRKHVEVEIELYNKNLVN